MLQAPDFWGRQGFLSDLLLPFSWGFAGLGRVRRLFAHPAQVGVPVLCVGNLVAGGAGKTPVVLSLAQMLRAAGHRPHILSRGYGGTAIGPLLVDPTRHKSSEVGDEPLLLAKAAPTWIGSDRVASAKAAIAEGAGILLLDDGFQNPSLHQDVAVLVVDGDYGLGNGRVIPAGPLREPVELGLARAQAIVVMGHNRTFVAPAGKIVLKARLAPCEGVPLKGKKVVAFAGIGMPQKFFATLKEAGAILVGEHRYPDHHPFRDTELATLARDAADKHAKLLTTEKDFVRLDPPWRQKIAALKVEIQWEDRSAVEALLERAIGAPRHGA